MVGKIIFDMLAVLRFLCSEAWLFWNLEKIIWGIVFKNGRSKISGRKP